jgi:hypothetical protein
MKGSHLMPRTQKAIVAKIMQRLRGNGWRVEYILSLYSMDVFGVIQWRMRVSLFLCKIFKILIFLKYFFKFGFLYFFLLAPPLVSST